jgi:hypothetical protein
VPLPPFISPQLTLQVEKPPWRLQWLHEIKLDGFRMAARIDNGRMPRGAPANFGRTEQRGHQRKHTKASFEALRGSVLTTLVGRKEEFGLLLRGWAKPRPAKAKRCSSPAGLTSLLQIRGSSSLGMFIGANVEHPESYRPVAHCGRRQSPFPRYLRNEASGGVPDHVAQRRSLTQPDGKDV